MGVWGSVMTLNPLGSQLPSSPPACPRVQTTCRQLTALPRPPPSQFPPARRLPSPVQLRLYTAPLLQRPSCPPCSSPSGPPWADQPPPSPPSHLPRLRQPTGHSFPLHLASRRLKTTQPPAPRRRTRTCVPPPLARKGRGSNRRYGPTTRGPLWMKYSYPPSHSTTHGCSDGRAWRP